MPFASEHACRLRSPSSFDRFRRQNGIGEVEGKRLDAIIGIKGNRSEIQAYRYPLSEGWTEAQARSHCSEHDGLRFEPAEPEDSMDDIDLRTLENQEREAEMEALDAYERGVSDAPVLYRPAGYVARAADDEEDPIEFVASEESEDRMGDVIRASGWDLKAFRRNPVLLFAHNHSVPAIGRVVKIGVDNRQLLAQTRFDRDDPFAAMLERKFRQGFMNAVSVGFRPLDFRRVDDEDGGFKGFEFKRQELLELSAVPVPAHPAALRKAYGGSSGVFRLVVPEVPKGWEATETTTTSSTPEELPKEEPSEATIEQRVERIEQMLGIREQEALPPEITQALEELTAAVAERKE